MTKLCILLATWACLAATARAADGIQRYACPPGTQGWPCLRNSDGSPRTVRVMFMDSQFVTTNPAAVAMIGAMGKTYFYGSTCDKPDTAVPECFQFENWIGGWVGGYMHQVLKNLGWNVVAMTRANFSADALAVNTFSEYTRCVWDVKFGNTDLCVGDFWETPERRELAVFTTPIDSDYLTLYTTLSPEAQTAPFEANQFLKIFAPFDGTVWWFCAVTMIACSLVMWIVEEPRVEARRGLLSTSKKNKRRGSLVDEAHERFETISEGFLDSMLAFFGAEDRLVSAATTWPGRLVCVAVCIFVFVHINTFSGSMSAADVATNFIQLGLVKGLQDIKRQGGNLCVLDSMAGATSKMITSIISPDKLVLADDYTTALEGLMSGDCHGALVGKFETLTLVAASNANFTVCKDRADPAYGASACSSPARAATPFRLNPATCGDQCGYARRFCSLVRLSDDTVSAISLAWELPVQPALQPWVSYAISRLHTLGNLTDFQRSELVDRNPVVCAGPSLRGSSMGLEMLSGTFVFCGGALALGLLVHGLMMVTYHTRAVRRAARRAKNPKPDLEAEEGGSTGAPEEGGARRVAMTLAEVRRMLEKAKEL